MLILKENLELLEPLSSPLADWIPMQGNTPNFFQLKLSWFQVGLLRLLPILGLKNFE